MTSAAPKTVLVTGAAQRIGRAIALRLARAGWRVAVHYNTSDEAAADTVAAIRAEGGDAVAVQADLGCDAESASLVARAREAAGPLAALVNNASVFVRDQWDTVTRESWNRNLDVNLWAPFRLSQDFARQLPEGESGAIVNLIDQRVWRLNPDFTSYTVSKTGLWTLTQTLAQALAPRIRVNGIGPGPVLQSIYQTPDAFAREASRVLLERSVSPEEIAETVLFLLCAPSITGQMIAVDGGQHLAWETPDLDGAS